MGRGVGMNIFKFFIFYCLVFVIVGSFQLESKTELPDTVFPKPAKKAIVIGATSGMGREVAKLIGKDGYHVGLVGRRINLLRSLQKEIYSKTYIKRIDVSKHEKAKRQLEDLIKEMGGLDLIVISVSAYSDINQPELWKSDKKIIDVDLGGFWIMADTAVRHFEKQKSGHLVGISSIDGLRGVATCPVYSGAKSFISRYLEAIRNKMIQNNISVYVTDIIPGWVNIEHVNISEQPGAYWVASTEEAGKQIYEAIKTRKKKAYITKRWQIIAWLITITPDWIYNTIGGF